LPKRGEEPKEGALPKLELCQRGGGKTREGPEAKKGGASSMKAERGRRSFSPKAKPLRKKKPSRKALRQEA